MNYLYKTLFVLLILLFALKLEAQNQDSAGEYKKTIEMADSYFTKGDYINAKASYQIAIRLAPDQQYPKDRLQQSLDMIKVQMYQNSLYTQKIQVADDLFNKKDFENALKYYQEALTILPGDVYSSGKIQEINRNQVDNKKLEEDYQKSISNGDRYFKEGKLEQAVAEYKNALTLKPAEAYPREKSLQLDSLISEKKHISDEYQTALRDAELALTRNKYEDAIKLLEKAINLMPNEPLPKQKLAEVQSLKAAWDSYSSIISSADEMYMNKDFQPAKEKYLQAQSIKPDDEYPKRMLEKIDIALMDVEQANRSSYEFSIERADALFNQQEYEKAMVEYNNALRFKPDADYAKQRINDINNALSLRNSQEEAYTQAVARADNLYKEEKFSEARDEYSRAIGIKPLEQYPKVKVQELDTKLADLASKRQLYDNLIKGADRLFFSDEYVEAREQYREANYLFPKEKYPLDQITMINEILGVRDKYVKSVTTADRLLSEKDLHGALLEYRNAAAIDPKSTYPLDKIKEIEAIQARFVNLVKDADNAMLAKDYQNALASYQNALNIKPGDTYAQGKIDEINQTLAEIAARETAEKAAAEVAARKAAEEAAALKAAEEAAAKKAAEEAAAIKAAEEAAAKKAAEEAAAIKAAEEAAAKKAAEEAAAIKAVEEAARAAEAALNKQFGDAISEADKNLAAKDYQNALAGYQNALNIKPGDTYAQGKIDEINQTLTEIAAREAAEKAAAEVAARKAAEEAAALKAAEEAAAKKAAEEAAALKAAEEAARAAEAALNKQFGDAISEADKNLAAKDYQNALAGYQNALNIKTGDTYAQGKIDEINQTLTEIAAREAAEKAAAEVAARKAAEEAAALKAAEEAAAKKAAEEAAALKAAEEAAAKKAAEEAAALKAAEEAAAKKAAEEAAAIKVAEEAARAAEAALNKQFGDAISEADKNLAAKDYQNALAGYQNALNIKPGDTYAQGKIDEINQTLTEIAAREAAEKAAAEVAARKAAEEAAALKAAEEAAAKKAAEEAAALKAAEEAAAKKAAEEAAAKKASEEAALIAEMNRKYNEAVSAGNTYFDKAQYEEARTSYQEAGRLKPAEELPKKQIIEIDRKIQALESERNLAFQVAISKADNFFSLQDFSSAKIYYSRALELKPGDSYTAQKLEEANLQITKQRQLVQEDYDKTIVEADKYFNSKTYDNALDAYRTASVLKPDEAYPKEMSARILKLLSERSIVQINKDPLLISNSTTHKFEFIPVPAKDRKSNYIFFKARNFSDKEYKLIISFGQDQSKNGGIVIKVPAGEDMREYIIRISAQYKWFSDDNNWISFYPEGGDIEVSLVQVSYSD